MKPSPIRTKPMNSNPFEIDLDKSTRELRGLTDRQIYHLLKQAAIDCSCAWCALAKVELERRNLKQAS